MANLTFCGAAGTVTGSCSKLITKNAKFLVDCGLFQGNKTTVALNYEPFPFNPKEMEFMILTHGHIDHTGLVPKLVNQGFNGPIYATQTTIELLDYLLRDGASIQESNAKRKNKKNQRRGLPLIEPLYTQKDAEAALALLKPVKYEEWFSPAKNIQVRYWNAGHILGSASAEMTVSNECENGHTLRLLFSGDIGPDEKVFHPEPDAPEGFDYIVCESTYGNRKRADYTLEGRRDALKKELVDGLARGGNVVIPSFAVERSQELLHDIGVIIKQGALKGATVYLDSPLAKKVTEIFIKHARKLDDLELSPDDLFQGDRFRLIESVDESKRLNQVPSKAIIISASGMCDAGRIQHHLKANIWRPECTVLLVGYQSPGTLGSLIQKGIKDIRIHGKEFKLRAQVRRLGNYSAHADQSELLDWIMERSPIVGGLFLNHGENDSRETLKGILADKGIDKERIYIPHFNESFELLASEAVSKGRDPNQRGMDKIPTFDWNNQYAAFGLELVNKLESAASNEERSKILNTIHNALAGHTES